MRKMLKIFIPILVILSLLTGCGAPDITAEDVQKLTTLDSTLSGTVEFVNGRTCRICVSEGDSHFDEDEVILVTFTTLEGSKKSIQVGDRVKVEYSYASQVSESQGYPHITVNALEIG